LGLLDKLKRKIPGIKGYYKQEDCRDTDQLIRKKIQDYLQRSADELSSVMEHFYNNGNESMSSTVDNIINEINKFRNDIQNASYGFQPKSRFVTKSNAEDYEQILNADAAMILVCDDLFNNASEISSDVVLSDDNQDIKHNLKRILKYLKELKSIFAQRKDFVDGISDVIEIKER